MYNYAVSYIFMCVCVVVLVDAFNSRMCILITVHFHLHVVHNVISYISRCRHSVLQLDLSIVVQTR